MSQSPSKTDEKVRKPRPSRAHTAFAKDVFTSANESKGVDPVLADATEYISESQIEQKRRQIKLQELELQALHLAKQRAELTQASSSVNIARITGSTPQMPPPPMAIPSTAADHFAKELDMQRDRLGGLVARLEARLGRFLMPEALTTAGSTSGMPSNRPPYSPYFDELSSSVFSIERGVDRAHDLLDRMTA